MSGSGETILKTRICDVDMFGKLRLSSLFSLLQNAAIDHTQTLGIDRTKTLDKGLLWLVTLQELRISRMPCFDEMIRIESWPGERMHLLFPRYHAICSANGEPLAEGSAIWVLYDAKKQSIAFPEEHGIEIEGARGKKSFGLPKPAKTLKSSYQKEFAFTCPFSRCDINGHLGNTEHFAIASDTNARLQSGETPARIIAEYDQQVKFGETVTIKWSESGDIAQMSAEKDGVKKFKLTFEFCGRSCGDIKPKWTKDDSIHNTTPFKA